MSRISGQAGERHGAGCVLRLFVAGEGALSCRAVAQLRELAERALPGRCELEVVDVLREPEEARAASVFAVPTLVRVRPAPSLRVVGDLVDPKTILRSLGLAGDDAREGAGAGPDTRA